METFCKQTLLPGLQYLIKKESQWLSLHLNLVFIVENPLKLPIAA